ncbi:hypothetical protein DESUT3_24200 [Desulfuromonas versatilis]|uniref:Lipoprotein n=1 Tax=Desulfuromonas versatilis TaxID=2802975 RepID=A0ABM8HTP2_9BACT|nr:hypothetical protein [Desulfuromonas versatilis]BCR05351.1 hypothetical protein DESUT3_24200 [Desulfuromonas versatilis]
MLRDRKKGFQLLFATITLVAACGLLSPRAMAAQEPRAPELAIDVLNGGIIINIENTPKADFEAYHPLRSSIIYINDRPIYLIDYTSNPQVKYRTETFNMDAKVKRYVFRHQPAISIENGDRIFIEWITNADERHIGRILSNSVVWQQ